MDLLIIHPKDKTTDFLKDVYEFKTIAGSKITVITDRLSKRRIFELCKQHSRVMIMGHGTEKGLLNPNGKGMIIDSNNVFYLRNMEVIGIWCHADKFFQKYGLKGFATSMFISDYTEAMYEGVLTNYEEIQQSNKKFAKALREIIDIPTELMEHFMKIYYPTTDKDEPLYEFNASGFKTFE